jgi:hypothetical protein
VSAIAAPVLDSPGLARFGYPELVKGSSPVAGAHFVQSVDSGLAARLLSVHVRLVTSATVADRQVVVEYRDEADNRFMLCGPNATQAASLTGDYIFSVFQPLVVATVDSSILVPLAPILLYPAFDFRIYVAAIDTTDQLSRVRFVWERFYLGVPPGPGA